MIEESDRELLRQATARLTGANAIIQFVSDYLRAKYNLSAGTTITPNGEIVLPPSEDKRFGGQFGLWDMQSEVAVSGETA